MAVESSLKNIKNSLSDRGFTVVDIEGYRYPIDAYVYEGHPSQLSFLSSSNAFDTRPGSKVSYGILMVNSAGRSIDEIETILRKRVYSPLF